MAFCAERLPKDALRLNSASNTPKSPKGILEMARSKWFRNGFSIFSKPSVRIFCCGYRQPSSLPVSRSFSNAITSACGLFDNTGLMNAPIPADGSSTSLGRTLRSCSTSAMVSAMACGV